MSEKTTIESERTALMETYGVPAAQEVGMIRQELSEYFKPLRKGNHIPQFSLPDLNGNIIKSSDLLDTGILVISFNRGNLCAFCLMEINTWQAYLEDLAFYGATFLTISGDKTWSDNYKVTGSNNNFKMLYDETFNVAEEFGLTYRLNDEYLNTFESFGIKLNDFYGKSIDRDQHKLPVPATFVVDTDGTIIYEFIEPDFTKRAEPYEVLKVIINHLNRKEND